MNIIFKKKSQKLNTFYQLKLEGIGKKNKKLLYLNIVIKNV